MALGIVFLLIFSTNILDKQYFSELQDSFSSVYKDRLLVESYVYRLSNQLHKKKLILNDLNGSNKQEVKQKNKKLDDSIDALIKQYETTRLTRLEAEFFADLKSSLSSLYRLESNYINKGVDNPTDNLYSLIEAQHQRLSTDLDQLSEIQLSESKNIIDKSNRIIAASNLTSQFEICMLIIMGLIIQALIFTSKSISSKFPQSSSLN